MYLEDSVIIINFNKSNLLMELIFCSDLSSGTDRLKCTSQRKKRDTESDGVG